MSSTGVASDSSLMSAPAENASSFPVRTVALIRSSLSKASRASTSSLRSSKFRAFKTLGLFRRMIPIGGSVSTSIWLNGKRDQFCRSWRVYKALGILSDHLEEFPVAPLAAFFSGRIAEVALVHHLSEGFWRYPLFISRGLEERFKVSESCVKPYEICKFERTHRVIVSQLHCQV